RRAGRALQGGRRVARPRRRCAVLLRERLDLFRHLSQRLRREREELSGLLVALRDAGETGRQAESRMAGERRSPHHLHTGPAGGRCGQAAQARGRRLAFREGELRGAEIITPLVPAKFLAKPHTSFATSTIIASFAHCSSSASALPSSVEAKPHCGDRQSCSSGMNFEAWSMRRLMSSFDSSRPVFEVTRPSTTWRSLGTKRSGSKPPARSESYSMKKPCTLILPNRISCTFS